MCDRITFTVNDNFNSIRKLICITSIYKIALIIDTGEAKQSALPLLLGKIENFNKHPHYNIIALIKA